MKLTRTSKVISSNPRAPGVKPCAGDLVGYFLPTKFAGPTNTAFALVSFPNPAAYEKYRDALMKDRAAVQNVARVEKSGCILNEERSFLERVS